MLAGADVVGGEIGEHPGIKCYPGCAVGFHAEAGHLHDAGVAAVIGHPAQQRLQVTALGRGVVQIVAVPRPAGTVCANQPHLPSVRLQDGRQQVGGGRLALGAGDAHQRHPPAGVAVQPRRKHGHHAARVVCLQNGAAVGQIAPGIARSAQHGRRPGCGGLCGVDAAVSAAAGQTDKKRPRLRTAGVAADAGDLGQGIPPQKPAAGIPDKAAQIHSASRSKKLLIPDQKTVDAPDLPPAVAAVQVPV